MRSSATAGLLGATAGLLGATAGLLVVPASYVAGRCARGACPNQRQLGAESPALCVFPITRPYARVSPNGPSKFKTWQNISGRLNLAQKEKQKRQLVVLVSQRPALAPARRETEVTRARTARTLLHTLPPAPDRGAAGGLPSPLARNGWEPISREGDICMLPESQQLSPRRRLARRPSGRRGAADRGSRLSLAMAFASQDRKPHPPSRFSTRRAERLGVSHPQSPSP